MILSMTGYGSAERKGEEWIVRAEVRSLNHNELRISARLPEMLRLKESELLKLVRAGIARGHVYLRVDCELADDALDLMVDKHKLAVMVRLAREIAEAEGVPVQATVGGLLSLPGAMSQEAVPEKTREKLWGQVTEVTQQALEDMVRMRRAEGEHLRTQLVEICARIRKLTEGVAERVPSCVKACQERLVSRVRELLTGAGVEVDMSILAREIAVLADRSDISEELTRMCSHLQQMLDCLDSDGGPVGLKMEFLTQEMLREANTMVTKLPSTEQAQQAIEIKLDVSRLLEQLRNIE